MGLTVSIYRTTWRDGLAVFGPVSELTITNVPGPSEPTLDAPEARLEYGPGHNLVIHAMCPPAPGMLGPMFSGSFAYSSDSRWREATGMYGAIPIHDRYETPAQYDMLSR